MNKNEELLPYYERARGILSYDPNTGVFTRFEKKSGLHKEAGSVNGNGYKYIGISLNGKQKALKAHRVAWFMYYGELPNVIDHVDGDTLNNSISNLRSGTQHQNTFNKGKHSNNTSGYKGVTWRKDRKKWKSNIGYEGKMIHLGYFNCPKEASEAYKAKARELHGEFYNEQ